MQKILPLILIVLMPLLMFGQAKSGDKKVHEKERFILEGSAGVSVPIGSYSTNDRFNKKSGFAQTGSLFQVTIDWMDKKDFGMALQYSYQYNPIQSSSVHDTLPGRTYPLGSGGWSNHYLMIGPVYYKEIKKFVIDAKVMGGLVFAFSPLFNYTSPDSLHTKVTSYGSGFAYEAAAGVGYRVSSNLQIKFDVSILGAIPTLHKQYGGEYLGTVDYRNPQTGAIEYISIYAPAVVLDLKNYISTFNASFGIIIKL